MGKVESVGIVGLGVIGQAVQKLFPHALIQDPARGMDNDSVFDCKYIFICVPTNLQTKKDGLNVGIVERIVQFRCKNTSIVIICSTLQPGTADKLWRGGKRIVVQPEYFGETVNHPLTDLAKQPFLVLGGDKEDVDEVIRLYQTVYNANIRIRRVTRTEAEIIKLSENRAIAFKIAQCQELYDACLKAGVDYNTVREAVYGDDPRFNLWWTFVYPEKRGFNSKCIPKDVYAWSIWAKSVGIQPELTDSVLSYNEKLINDRVECNP